MNNKKELQEKLDALKGINENLRTKETFEYFDYSDIFDFLDEIETIVNSLPDNFEAVKEVKLSEIIERLQSIYTLGKITHCYYVNAIAIWLEDDDEMLCLFLIKNNLIVKPNCGANENKWLYQYWINNTKIIDDLKESE